MDFFLGVIVFAVIGISGVIVVLSLFGESGYNVIGGRGPQPPAPEHETAELREADVRQMLEVRSRRRIARGEPGGDVEAELQELLRSSPSSSEPAPGELREEAHAIVQARRARRRRHGEPEGDLEAEVTALLEELGG